MALSPARREELEKKKPVVPRSLMISPNLDALLEHEERNRSEVVREMVTASRHPPLSVSTTGLPPPPRGPRRGRSAVSPMASPQIPYFFGMEDAAHEQGGLQLVVIQAPPVVEPSMPAAGSGPTRNPYINPPPTLDELMQAEEEEGKADGRGPPGSRVPEERKGVRRSRDATNVVGTTVVRRRPLLSHGGSASASVSSLSSSSSLRPLSTADHDHEPRISISSTIYPASSAHSHPSMYTHRRLSSLDRRSFIDFLPDPLPVVQPPKPPVPTTPKPLFARPARSPRQSSSAAPSPLPLLPPTTNLLDWDERADLIKKSRKLARVFGQTPSADAIDCARASSPSLSTRRSPQAVRSISKALDNPVPSHSDVQFLSTATRRHSLPLSPDDFVFVSMSGPNSQLGSRASFIDLSDEEILDDPSLNSPGLPRPPSPSAQSLFENMSPEQQAEEDRKRKREKLAKLHRFLGSRVPANLVLGLEDPDTSLPPPHPPSTMTTPEQTEEASRKAWLRRRRSSSAAAFPTNWRDDVDRMKDDLGDKEKAINVRRAQKMEKVFGVAPPQTMYHTRHSPSAPVVLPVSSPPDNATRNTNKSAYVKLKKKTDRPGTSDSNKALLSNDQRDSLDGTSKARHSIVYNHYQHSLNSLNDIIDRDDRASLAELHDYLTSGPDIVSPTLQEFTRAGTRRISNASAKSERRRSLPARTSIASLRSEYSIASPDPDTTEFQLRRRRAAKLTQFFGVDYRELINDVLESIENGVEHERKRGFLRAEEVEDLLEKLRNLRRKRSEVL